jgi:RNA polymerase sigma factor (sigma-70 family)
LPGSDEFPGSPAAVVVAAGAGDGAAWEALVLRYGGLVRAKVRGFRLQDADAQDAMQATWLRLAENIHRLRDPECLPGWLATTARRECLRLLQCSSRQALLTEAEAVADPTPGPEQQVLDAEAIREVLAGLAKLPLHSKTLLRELFAEDRPRYAEIAHRSGMAVGSIGPKRARVLTQLRRNLSCSGADRPGLRPGL